MIKGLILIGGKSTRMGTEKYLLNPNDKPQLQFIQELLSTQDISPYISCNKHQASDLDQQDQLIIDQYDSIGPLNGLASAFAFDPTCSWLVVACDLIHLTKSAIEQLIQNNSEAFDVVTYQKKDSSLWETTLTIYNPGVGKYIQDVIDSKNYSLQHLLKQCNVKTIQVENDDFLINANRPEDL